MRLRQKSLKKIVGALLEMMTPKSPFEINRPLPRPQNLKNLQFDKR